MFHHLIGHSRLKEHLQRLVERRAVPPALLFAGPEGVGKGLFARALAAALLTQVGSSQHARALAGQHPDFHEYLPEGKSGQHSIEALRTLSSEVYMAPYEAKHKVFVIHAAERMLPYSANALLKTFEEPATDTIIILLSSAPALLLPTVLSRCCTVHFGVLAPAEMQAWLQEHLQVDREQAATLAINARGSLGRACRLASGGEESFVAQLLPILAQGRFASYADLTAAACALAEQIEALGQTGADERRKGKTTLLGQGLTAMQRQSIEKDAEGTAAVQQACATHILFEAIVAWYRDMAIVHYRSPQAILWHSNQREALEQAVQRGQLRELDGVIAAIEEANLAFQRSNPLAHVLETLFLRLGLF